MNTFIEFAQVVGIPALIGGGAAWGIVRFLGHKLVDQKLKQDIERYKEDLRQRSEVLKTNLSIYTHEQITALSRIDVNRSKAIKEIFECFREWTTSAAKIKVGSYWENATESVHLEFYTEAAEQGYKATKELHTKLADNAIYFSNEDTVLIAAVADGCMTCIADFLQVIRKDLANNYPEKKILEDIEVRRDEFSHCAGKSTELIAEHIVPRFRILLGVTRLIEGAND